MGYMTGVEEELRVKWTLAASLWCFFFWGCIKKSKVLGSLTEKGDIRVPKSEK